MLMRVDVISNFIKKKRSFKWSNLQYIEPIMMVVWQNCHLPYHAFFFMYVYMNMNVLHI